MSIKSNLISVFFLVFFWLKNLKVEALIRSVERNNIYLMIIENYSQSKREKMCLYLIYNILASSSKITTPRANTRAFHAHLSHFEINRLSRPKASRVPNSFNMFFSRSSNFLLLLCGISNVCFTCATASSIQTFLPDVFRCHCIPTTVFQH